MGAPQRGSARRRGGALWAVWIGAIAVLAMLAGCGGGSEGASSTTSAASLDGLTAAQVLAKAHAVAGAAKSVRLSGDLAPGVTVDLLLAGVARGSGTVIQQGGRIELVRVGNDLYFKADDETLSNTVAGGDATIVAKIAGRYVKGGVDTAGFADFAALLDLVGFVNTGLKPEGAISRVPGVPVDGVPTVGLKSPDADGGGILYVASHGDPYPLRLQPSTGAEAITMSDWNAAATIEAPPADHVIDITDL